MRGHLAAIPPSCAGSETTSYEMGPHLFDEMLSICHFLHYHGEENGGYEEC